MSGRKKGKPVHEPSQRERRRKEVADLILDGKTLTEVAQQLGISVGTAWNDITYARNLWRSETIASVEAHRQQELSKLEVAEREALKGWIRSQENALSVQVKETAAGTETTKTTKGQAGDASFIGKIIDCIDKRAKLLGIYAPQKNADTDRDGNDLTMDERRDRLAETLARIGQRGGFGLVGKASGPTRNGHAGPDGNGDEPR